jgi:hypothetical protein
MYVSYIASRQPAERRRPAKRSLVLCSAIASDCSSRSSSCALSCAKLHSDFAGGENERNETLEETELDYSALVGTGAEAARLEATLAAADRQATQRECDLAAVLMLELVAALAARLLPRGR